MAQGAKILVQGPEKTREIAAEDFFVGVKKTSLEPGEIVTGIVIPPLADNESAVYIKHAVRKAMDLAIIGVAVKLKVEDGICTDAKIALGAVAVTPIRVPKAEEVLIGKKLTDDVIIQASEEAMNSCHPISDIRASAEYRKDMVRVFTKFSILIRGRDRMNGEKNNIRNLYLIRHGKVKFSDGIRRCVGRTDLPLSHVGILQAEDLEIYFKEHPVEAVFSSPLKRCRDTAAYVAANRCEVQIRENLIEQDMGEWENVPMCDLKKTLEAEPISGESRRDGLKRFSKEIEHILNETTGDVACVAHAGVNCCFLSQVLNSPLEQSKSLYQPYGGISRIEIDKKGNMRVAELGIMPTKAPNPFKCEKIWEIYNTPEDIREH